MLPYQNRQLALEERIYDLLGRLTLEEKVHLCHGCSGMEVGGIVRLQIPLLQMADGPQGVRLPTGWTDAGAQATAFPCGMALAANFDPTQAEAYGEGIALDAAAVNVQVSLGPGFNLMRTPLNGRNFEYYGEDPVLAGKTAAGYVRGCQRNRVAATPKHLALNNQEICRTTGSSDIDERTLRELYLTAFEIVTKESQPWMMMSSYNRINGQYAAECGLTQELIVKREWGFDGVMVSDWGGAHDTLGCALGGLDLEMGCPPEGEWFGTKLLDAVRAGAVPMATLDDKVRRVLRLLFRTGVMDGVKPEGELGGVRQQRIAADTAAGGMVLLKNDCGLLPLQPAATKKLVVLGPNADFRHHRGTLEYLGGSGAVFSEREVTPLAGLREYAALHDMDVAYFPVLRFDHDTVCPAGLFGAAGLREVYYHETDELRERRNPLFERASRQGIWNWIGAGNQTAGGSDTRVPTDRFGMYGQATLQPPTDAAAELHCSAQYGALRVKLNGRVVLDLSNGPVVTGKYVFQAGEARGCELEIEFFSGNAAMARLNLGWRELDTAGEAAALAAARAADAVIFVGGTHHLYDKEALGWGDIAIADIPDLALPGRQDELIAKVAAANPRTVVVLINGSAVNVEAWIDRVPALLEAWYPGEMGGRVLAGLLFGERAPAGRLPFTWAKRLEDYACHGNGAYPGTRGAADPRVAYTEGEFIGYRHFDRAGIEPRFPFGYGLTYTDFAVELLACETVDAAVGQPRVKVRVAVTNTGKRAGCEVVQLYVGALDAALGRPEKELKAFAKVNLAPGAREEVDLCLQWRDFAGWEAATKRWLVPAGTYRLSVGTSARRIVATAEVSLKG